MQICAGCSTLYEFGLKYRFMATELGVGHGHVAFGHRTSFSDRCERIFFPSKHPRRVLRPTQWVPGFFSWIEEPSA